ncbi:MAG: hypothetical protein E7639_02520 [Ruminococcaceae bacterium]|nr:hypothetical protein [Oscillospiraceae bacterium]
MKKQKTNEILLPLAVSAVLALGGLALWLFPVPRFSPSENRMLAARPDFSWQSLWQGDYTAAWESYTAERLTVRDTLRATHAMCELALGKGECGGVMLGSDKSLAARPQVNEKITKRNLAGIAAISTAAYQKNVPFLVGIVPYRAEARRAVFPASYSATPTSSLCAALSSNGMAVTSFEGITNDNAWFRTDHHWTPQGAYAAYCMLAPLLGFEPYGEDTFEKIDVSCHFFGTGARAAGLPQITPDTITLWRFTGDDGYCLYKDGKAADFMGLYDLQKLDTCDEYAVFLGGNDGLLTVKQAGEDDRPTLLLWRDSYAAALIPFLSRHYQIIAVDPRYYRGDTATLLASADKALLLAGAVTLSQSAFLNK